MTRYVGERDLEREILVALARVAGALGDRKWKRHAERLERMDREAFSDLDFVSGLKKRFVREGEDERVADLRGGIAHGATAIHPSWPAILSNYLQLGERYGELGQDENAYGAYKGGLSTAREKHLPAYELAFLNALAFLDRDNGKHAEAIEAWQKAILLARSTGDKHAEASLLVHLGDLHNDLGRHDEALKLCRESRAIFRQIGNAQEETYAEIGEGAALTGLGDLPQALAALENARRGARHIGAKDLEARALFQCGIVYSRMGDGKPMEFGRSGRGVFR